MVATPAWAGNYRLLSWLSLVVFFIGFLLFFLGYVGNSWYVVPVENNHFPPDNPVAPLTFGLFYMCYRGHCKYDLRQDYRVVELLPPEMEITTSYQKFRTACMAIITVAASIILITLGVYFLFLSGFFFSHFIGYAAGGLQIFGGIIAMIGVIIFGVQFRGASKTVPFGWSMALVIAALIILIINGVMLIFLTVSIMMHVSKVRSTARGRPTEW